LSQDYSTVSKWARWSAQELYQIRIMPFPENVENSGRREDWGIILHADRETACGNEKIARRKLGARIPIGK